MNNSKDIEKLLNLIRRDSLKTEHKKKDLNSIKEKYKLWINKTKK